MAKFNSELTELILRKCSELSLKEQVTKEQGRFIADKSYAFDTMFFVCRYIQYFRFGDMYRRDHREREEEYIADLFGLERGRAQIKNYFTEALALLRFLKAVEYDGRDYHILDEEILEIFSSSFENAYIFLYLLCFSTLKKHGLWQKYMDFCNAESTSEKQRIYDDFRKEYVKYDARVIDDTKAWAIFTPKYPMVVLNYANKQNMVSRTGRVQDSIVERTDISLNTEGTRNNYEMPKKNSYLADMSDSYIVESLRSFLTDNPPVTPVTYSDTISIDIADTKLQMIAERFNLPVKKKSQGSKYKYVGGTKTRTVQGEFRSGLLQKTPHICPVCGFSYEDFLIASHIKPYAKCEDTYDAMNPNNGLLMCPICDKLFESANLMTIHSQTGEIVYSPKIEAEKDFQYLHGKKIAYDYIDCERRHYLRWHNSHFAQKHNITLQ